MTLAALRGLVRHLSNQCHVRYWIGWNYPRNPSEMALSLLDWDGRSRWRIWWRAGFGKNHCGTARTSCTSSGGPLEGDDA